VRETKTNVRLPAPGHTNGTAVQENVVAATCDKEGSYDEVVYCAVCDAEISREAKTIEKIAHTPVTDAAVAATCTETGLTEGSHCSVCDTVLVAQEVVPVIDHTAGEVQIENNTPSTCDYNGFYNEVIYCTVCNAKLSDNTIDRDKDPENHSAIVSVAEVPATVYSTGVKAHYECAGCGKLFSDELGENEITIDDIRISRLVIASVTVPSNNTTDNDDTAGDDTATDKDPADDTTDEPADDETEKVVFDDVAEGYWGETAINYVASNKIFKGTADGVFAPESNMTRAMFITVLARIAGQDTDSGSTWYENGVNWATANGVSDGSDLSGNITREQIALMLWRYAGEPTATQTELDFTDADQVSSYAQQALLWANENGIVKGLGNGILNPKGQASRAQVAQMIYNYLTGLAK
jgi:hypothetical protein